MKTAHRKGPSLVMQLAAAIAAAASPAAGAEKPLVLYTPPRFTAYRGMGRPPVGWRKAQSRRRHQEIQRRQRRNRRA